MMDAGTVARIVALIAFLGVVVGVVGGMGFALGRLSSGRRRGRPTLPDDPGRRLRLMEEEMEQLQSEVAQLREQREFDRRLGRSGEPESARRGRDVA